MKESTETPCKRAAGADRLDSWLTKSGSVWARYGIAALAVVAAIVLDNSDFLSGSFRIYLVFYPFIIIAALYGGLGPGLLAIALSCFAVAFFWAEPVGNFAVASRADRISMAVFIVGNLFFVWICQRTRRAVQQAAQAEEHRKSAAQLKQIIDLVPHFIFVKDRDGNFLLANQSVADAYNTTVAELKGKPQAGLHKEESELHRMLEDDREVIESGRTKYVSQESFVDNAGKRRILETIKVPFFTFDAETQAVLGVAVDITERKRAEEALRESEAKLRIVTDNTYDWEFWVSPTEEFIYTSPSCLRITGHTADEFQADPELFIRIIHPDDQAAYIQHRHDVSQNKTPGKIEFRVISSDGAERWITHVCQPVFSEKGQFLGTRGNNRDSTERKRADVALRESEAFGVCIRDSLIEHLVVLDSEGVIIAVNRAWRRFAETNGAPELAANSIGLNYLATCEKAPSYPHGEEAAAARQGILAVLNGELAEFSLEYPCHSPDKPRWFQMHVGPLRNTRKGVVIAHLDITKRTLAEDELHRINRIYGVLSQVNQAVLHVSSQQELLERICEISVGFGAFKMAWVGKLNNETRQVIPVASAGDDGRYLEKISVYADDRPEGRGPIGICLREERTYVCNDFRRDSSTHPWREAAKRAGFQSIVSLPLRKEGTIYGALAVYASELNCFRAEEVRLLEEVAANISFALDHLELETRRRQDEMVLKQAKEGAETANRAKEQFIAALSHELRTPLTPVLATVTALEEQQDLSADMRTDMELVHRNVNMEAALIDDLLDVTRINAGKIVMHPEAVDSVSCLQAALKICQDEIEAKHLKLSMSPPASEHHVWADATRLRQVFWNLLRNAVKFTPEGGRISIRSTNNNGNLKIEISDTGIGISPEVLPRLFTAFEQGEKTTTRSFGGLGLGLSIAKAIVELLHGKLTVFSEGKDKGATFIVELATTPAVPELPTPPSASVPRPEHSLRILLVEDHVDTLQTMTKLLRKLGYTVATANSVKTALDLAAKESFDLLISDLGLPDGSGLDIMRQIRKLYALQGIALSGYGTEEDIRQSHDAGFRAHLVKPVSIAALREGVQQTTATSIHP